MNHQQYDVEKYENYLPNEISSIYYWEPTKHNKPRHTNFLFQKCIVCNILFRDTIIQSVIKML
jgi:hypothetical protein